MRSLGGIAPAEGILVLGHGLAQVLAYGRPELGLGLQEAAYGKEAGAAQDVVVAEVVVAAEIDDRGEEHAAEGLRHGVALDEDFRVGLRYAPAYVAALLGHAPHKPAHDVLGLLGMLGIEAGREGAERHGGAQAHHGLEHEEGHERTGAGHAAFGDFGKVLAPFGTFQPGLELGFQAAQTCHGVLLWLSVAECGLSRSAPAHTIGMDGAMYSGFRSGSCQEGRMLPAGP